MSDTDNAKNQARAQMSSILAMVAALEVDYDRLEELREEKQSLQDDYTEAKKANEERPSYWSELHEKAARLKHYDATGDMDMPLVKAEKDAQDALNTWLAENSEELVELEDAAGDNTSEDDAKQAIDEDPLSVEIRSGWYQPGDTPEPEEFNILLCTGGPAVRIMGELDQHKQPCRAWLEYQDWGTPWTHYYEKDTQDALLTYCRQFYFGE
jgi:hypothetical protein